MTLAGTIKREPRPQQASLLGHLRVSWAQDAIAQAAQTKPTLGWDGRKAGRTRGRPKAAEPDASAEIQSFETKVNVFHIVRA